LNVKERASHERVKKHHILISRRVKIESRKRVAPPCSEPFDHISVTSHVLAADPVIKPFQPAAVLWPKVIVTNPDRLLID
jgi:hypothetical protein